MYDDYYVQLFAYARKGCRAATTLRKSNQGYDENSTSPIAITNHPKRSIPMSRLPPKIQEKSKGKFESTSEDIH